MGFASGLALVLLTLVGYSSGAVLAGRGRQVAPGVLDLCMVVVLWATALATRVVLERWLAILVWLVVGLVVGAVLAGLRKGKYPGLQQMAPAALQSANGLQRWWEKWKVFAIKTGNYQGRVLLAFFYFAVVTPFGISLRLFGDSLRMHRPDDGSFWLERRPMEGELEEARQQF
jgi:hypothetical protein